MERALPGPAKGKVRLLRLKRKLDTQAEDAIGEYRSWAKAAKCRVELWVGKTDI